MRLVLLALSFGAVCPVLPACAEDPPAREMLHWTELPPLPDEVGVAGPFVGVHNEALIVAGGANFPMPYWESEKAWVNDAWVLTRARDGSWEWITGLKLDRKVGYGASVSSPQGVVCMGGNHARETFKQCFLLQWDPENERLVQKPLPDLPRPCAHGAAAILGEVVYLAGGQTGEGLETAMTNFWRLDLSRPESTWQWEILPPWPGPARAFNLTVAQHNGFDSCIYVISGRSQRPGTTGVQGVEPLVDVYEFNPARFDRAQRSRRADTDGVDAGSAAGWHRRRDAPASVMAGAGIAVGQSHVFVLSGADGSLMAKADELRLDHPGFPKRVLAYHTITDTWTDAGRSPANQVATQATWFDGRIVLAAGEIKPRARTTAVWSIQPVITTRPFGWVNSMVLIAYLLAMLGVGVYFARKSRNTDDYFRGGKKMLWWATGCSIFATMLSSITYMAIPAKAYAQDLVYLVGNMTIPMVAPIAVYLALPFFRRIDATSAYEYLEQRFNRPVRLFASASFTLFHIFRIGIVLSLAALALTTVTPLSPAESVLLMGVLSIIYCTLGGVAAVIWTDTIQTVVLLGGVLLCFGVLVAGIEGGLGALLATAWQDGKLNAVNWHLDPTSASLALWVVILGGVGQNLSSYTADQAVVQRYMTTPDRRRAAGSIWTAALLSIPASFLFYFLGTGLYVFYKSNPDKLDPTFMTDQIFPLFIAHEVPIGIAGLIVAGIFAAAQSTVSTSMNSTATAVVTDFLRPFGTLRTERGYLRCARGLTLAFGTAGTLLGLLFVDPGIRSLFDQFLKVIGLFMGVLGGLFALGVLTRRANGWAALLGALVGASVMGILPLYTRINGYLYAAIGITVCFGIGYGLSLLIPLKQKPLAGLTIHHVGWAGDPFRRDTGVD